MMVLDIPWTHCGTGDKLSIDSNLKNSTIFTASPSDPSTAVGGEMTKYDLINSWIDNLQQHPNAGMVIRALANGPNAINIAEAPPGEASGYSSANNTIYINFNDLRTQFYPVAGSGNPPTRFVPLTGEELLYHELLHALDEEYNGGRFDTDYPHDASGAPLIEGINDLVDDNNNGPTDPFITQVNNLRRDFGRPERVDDFDFHSINDQAVLESEEFTFFDGTQAHLDRNSDGNVDQNGSLALQWPLSLGNESNQSHRTVGPDLIKDFFWPPAMDEEYIECIREVPEIVKLIEDVFGEGSLKFSPLVLDLDDSGTIDLTSLVESGAYFDLDGDGFAERTGWVQPQDGLLAADWNGDGEINDISELFGNGSIDGFTELAQYDANADGVINSEDAAVWDKLSVWQDTNQNGFVNDGELNPLSYYDIVSIDLNATEVSQTNQGNDVSHTSTFTVDDGVNPPDTRPIHDIWFDLDNMNTYYLGDYEIDPEVSELGIDMRGYGNIPDLYVAMTEDKSGTGNLFDLVKDFSEISFNNLFDDSSDRMEEVEAIMFRWAGVDGVDPDSRGTNVDAQKLEFLEEFVGEEWTQIYVMDRPNPGPTPAQDIHEAFHIAQGLVYGRLMVLSAGQDLFDGDWFYNPFSDTFEGTARLNADALGDLETLAGTMGDKESFWQNVVRMVAYTVEVENLTGAEQDALDSAIYNSDNSLTLQTIIDGLDLPEPQGTTVTGTSGDDTLSGGTGEDKVYGNDGNDTLYGDEGFDEIYGGDGDDTLDGEAGIDLLFGGDGDDTYLVETGEGEITYIEESGVGTGNDDDRIVFGSGVDINDLNIYRASNTGLVIEIDTGSWESEIAITNQFNYTTGGGHVELLEFSDTSTYSLENLAWTLTGEDNSDDYLVGVSVNGLTTDTIYGGSGNDRIEGGDGDDTLYGEAGNDAIYGEGDDDTIEGGAGNDTIYGGDNDDTIDGGADDDRIYGGAGADDMTAGTGNDRIEGAAGDDIYRFEGGRDYYVETSGSDHVYVDAAWASTDAQYFRTNNMLRVYFDEDNYFDIQNFFGGASNQIETIHFDGESPIDLTSVTYVTQGDDTNNTINDGSSDTVIYGAGGDDTINAGGGEDIVYGGSGDDNINGGYGADWMSGGTGNDDLHGGGGGDDTFYYESGHDIMEDVNGTTTDLLVMAEGWTADDISFARYWNGTHPEWSIGLYDLVIELNGGATNSIVLENHFTNTGHIDILQFADASTIDLKDQAYTTYGTSSGETISGIGVSWGTNDIIYGYGGDDTLNGGNGTDVLYGGDGNDSLTGGSADDILSGGAGDDNLHGGGGADTFIYDGGIDIIRESGSGAEDVVYIDIDTVTVNDISVVQDGTYNADLIINSGVDELDLRSMNTGGNRVDWLEFTDGFTIWLPTYRDWTWGTDSSDILTGDSGANEIIGMDGNDDIHAGGDDDTVHGGSGNDTIYGEGGDDLLHGGTGNDVLYAGAGNDTLYGGDGGDTYVYESGLDTIYETDSGYDVLQITGGVSPEQIEITATGTNDITIVVNSGTDEITLKDARSISGHVSTIQFDDGSTVAVPGGSGWIIGTTSADELTGGYENNVILGDAGNDTIDDLGGSNSFYGGAGADDITGADGVDVIYGEDGDDILRGGSGGDLLDGGADNDDLYGGEGDDLFVFTGGLDEIYDTGSGQDVVRISTSGTTVNDISINDTATYDATLVVNASTDEIFLDNLRGAGTDDRVEFAEFADGFMVDLTDYGNWTWGTASADTETGDANDNVIIGKAGDDDIDGLAGQDSIHGGAGADTIDGGDDADNLHGGAGIDTINGDGGDDLIQGGDGADILDGGADDDTIYGQDDADDIDGGSGEDILYGGAGNDVLEGEGDADTLYGEAGNDTLDGGAGDDILYGGDGDDDLTGGGGSDTFVYTGGLDEIYETSTDEDTLQLALPVTISDITIDDDGTYDAILTINDGVDEVFLSNVRNTDSYVDQIEFQDGFVIDIPDYNNWDWGTTGDDTETGDGNANTIIGMAGDDTIDGAAGADMIHGGAGADDIDGGDDADYIHGGTGSDTIAGGAGNDILDGGSETDTVDYSAAAAGVTVDLSAGTASDDGDGGSDTLSNIENITGSGYGDDLTGDWNANAIDAGAGNDTLDGGAGDDDLDGGAGTDTVDYSSAVSGVSVDLGAGEASYDGFGGTDTLANIENITGSENSDSLSGDDAANDIEGNDGDDILSGAGGNDVLDGGDGTDTASYATAAAGVTASLASGTVSDDGDSGSDTFTSIENLTGSDYVDDLTGDGSVNVINGLDGNDAIDGGAGDDVLYGGEGADDLDGQGDSDTLYGEGGNDDLDGGAGDDILYGGDGDDDLTGGSGSDIFVYSGGLDEVYETGTDEDTLRLALPVTISDITIDDDGTYDAILTIDDGIDEVFLSNVRNTDSYVDKIEFEDGFLIDIPDYNNWDWGTSGDDTKTGDGNANTILGMDGDDVIDGAAGDDVIHGGAGEDDIDGGDDADYIHGGADDDTIDGEGGNDTLIGGAGNDAIDGGAGTDTVDYSASNSFVRVDLAFGEASRDGFGGSDTLTNVENVIGSAYADELVGDANANQFYGGEGNDYLSGAGGADTLHGEDGADTIDGGADGDVIYGEAGNDVLNGDGAADWLSGGSGADTINGGDGADDLLGGDDDDFLDGGLDADDLWGGDGADIFNFSNTSSVDTIKDFNTTEGDALDISDILTGYDAQDPITDWIEITTVGSDSVVKVDTNGGGDSFTQIALIEGVTGLTDEQDLYDTGHILAA